MDKTGSIQHGITLMRDKDIDLFRQGTHAGLYEKLGAHVFAHGGKTGTLFAVWAPNAQSVSVIGDFNSWTIDTHPLKLREDGSGIWEDLYPACYLDRSINITLNRVIMRIARIKAIHLPFSGKHHLKRLPESGSWIMTGATMTG